MLSRVLKIVASVLILIGVFGFHQLPKTRVQLWCAGFMHADEVKGRTGQVWMGLYKTENGFELRSGKIRVIDSVEGLSDKYVAVDHGSLPIFLIRGLESLKGGRVITSFHGNQTLIPGDRVVPDSTEQPDVDLTVSGQRDGEIIHRYEIILHKGRISQSLLKYDTAYLESCPALLWAGDLDHDGKLDLLLDALTGNGSLPTLFLSSAAGQRQLVRKVASYNLTGC